MKAWSSSQSWPVTVSNPSAVGQAVQVSGRTFGADENVQTGFNGNTNIFSIALKAYFGGGGRNGGLVDYQRNGATSWDGAPTTILGTTF